MASLKTPVLAIDPGRRTGVALVQGDAVLRAETLDMHTGRLAVYRRLHFHLEQLAKLYPAAWVVADYSSGGMRLLGFIEGECALLGLPYQERTPAERRQWLAGVQSSRTPEERSAIAFAWLVIYGDRPLSEASK